MINKEKIWDNSLKIIELRQQSGVSLDYLVGFDEKD